MITDKRFNVIAAFVMAVAVVISCIAMALTKSDTSSDTSLEYPEELFSKDMITIDIQADQDSWQKMLDNANNEEYIMCDLVINGKKFSSVGIRPKGNSSLTTVASSESDRFSFKLQFDEYIEGQTCYGLDKFVVNNVQSDSSYMKEYLSYDMMKFMGVDCPLFTYADITVNGEAWGLYLAVESYEESFVQRNYGTSDGNLYNVKMVSGDRSADAKEEATDTVEDAPSNGNPPEMNKNIQMPEDNAADTGIPENTTEAAADSSSAQRTPPQMGGGMQMPDNGGGQKMGGGGMGGNNGGSLEYTDDDSDSYSALFQNAVFGTSNESDFQRVITALKNLSTGTDLEKYFNVDQILRYFAVHTTVVNLDSYVSNMQQNYCLYENDGKVTILPWDYNLSFGGFQSGSASSAVNFPIDTPVSGVELSSRPLLAKLLEVPEYAEKYHEYLQKIVDGYFNSGVFEKTINELDGVISDYVKNDATAFYTYDEYVKGVDTLTEFGLLRAKSLEGQLDGTIPSTTDGQTENPDALIDASGINLSDMGSQGKNVDGGIMGRNIENRQNSDTKTGATANARQGAGHELPDSQNSDSKQGNLPQNQQSNVFSAQSTAAGAGLVIILIAGIIFAKKYKKK